jgi:hypothetical protein
MATFFSEQFRVARTDIHAHGAFDVSLVTDLPLFIDPFLLFNSKDPRFQVLHENMIQYLRFLRDKAQTGTIDEGLLYAWYQFPEVRQTWLGFTREGNAGSGLGPAFAKALHENLNKIFGDFGKEKVTKGSHLEKLCLVRDGIGRDHISDFTTNLIKGFLCEYTQDFARTFLKEEQRKTVVIQKARFNYQTEVWAAEQFDLPWLNHDYVLLTPSDILTKHDTWINKGDLIGEFEQLPDSVPNEALRAQINNYFLKALAPQPHKEPTARERQEAAMKTILEFPVLIDYYIRQKEDHGTEAAIVSAELVEFSRKLYLQQVQQLQDLLAKQSEFYKIDGDTYEEAHQRLRFLKDVIENKGGQRLFYMDGKAIQREEDIQIMYRLTWLGTPSDISREVNDGRGPADFKASRGGHDKTIIEFKLASNSKLKQNLAKQVEVYKKASGARHGIKCIVFFTEQELEKTNGILRELGLTDNKDIVLIDARMDNKPSGSKA